MADIQISSSGVRGTWSRHGLLLAGMMGVAAGEEFDREPLPLYPVEEQIKVSERISLELRERHVEAHHTGDLLAVDTSFVGHLEGAGKAYLRSTHRLRALRPGAVLPRRWSARRSSKYRRIVSN